MEVKGYLEEDKKYVEQNNPVGGNMNRSSKGHMELALRMLEEAREYVPEGDAVQASEKLYKAAEESPSLSLIEFRDSFSFSTSNVKSSLSRLFLKHVWSWVKTFKRFPIADAILQLHMT
jgi:hypothetical protein